MSFKGKSLLVLALLQSLLLAGVMWAGYAHYVQEETGHIVDRLVSQAQGLAATASDAVVAQDLATLDRYTRSVRDTAGLAYVHILDEQGRTLSGVGDAYLLQRPFSADEDFATALYGDGIFDQSATISLDGQVFGRVELGLDLAPVSAELAELRRDALLISLAVVTLVILATAVLLQLMTRPLSKLALAASGMAEGNFNVSLPAAGRDEIGQLAAGFASMREQVERSQQALKSDALREARHAQDLMDNVMDGIISIDEQGQIRDFNPAAERIFGYACGEVLGCNVSLLMPEPDHGRHDDYLRHYLETGEKKIIGGGREVQGRRKDGSLFPVDLAVNALEVDGSVLFTGIIRDITQRKQAEAALVLQQQQLETIRHAQTGFILSGDPNEFFERVLQDILALTQSEYGLVGEVMHDEQGQPYIKAYALSNIAWDDATRKFYAENAPQGLEFRNIDNLLSKAITSGEIVISNDPATDPRAVGIPPGHPPLNAFLGAPIYHGERLLGMIGLSNRPGGYDDELVEQLRPILSTCAQLLDALGKERERQQIEAALSLQQKQLETIRRAQTSFIAGGDPGEFFERLLPDILELTNSTFGFLGELMHEESGTPYLAIHALNDVTWDKDVQQIFTQNAQRDLHFYDFDNLFTRALQTGQPVFANDLDQESHSDNMIAGYESLHDFLGVPLFLGERLLGVIGVANRPGGYDEQVLAQLHPILGTCAQLFDALGKERERLRAASELQRANDLIESVLANLWAGMLVEDESRRILSLNPAYRKLFVVGDAVPALEGEDGEAEIQRIRTLFVDPEAFDRQIRDCLQGQRVVTQVELPLNDGRIYELEYIPIISTDDAGVVQTTHLWSYRNVTQSKQVEVQLRNQTEDLLEAKDEAEAADKAKGQFLATMSHEIRTPLNGVLGMLHLLGKTPLTDKQQRFVSTATGSGEMLLAVINDILDYSKLEAGRLELESIPFDPLELVEDIVALMARHAQEKGLELICAVDHHVPRWVRGDPTRLRQVLTNLINNAIKFTEQGDVVVHLSAVEGSAAESPVVESPVTESPVTKTGIHFAVQDSGIGITPEQQQRLFKSFSQVDSSHTRKYGGTGLGLAICQRLVAAMGSEIRVVSTPGQGSVFGFSLPLKAVDEGAPQVHRQVSDGLSRQRILVVADNFNLRDTFCKMLLSWQVSQVSRANNGADALAQLRAAAEQGQAYDIALLDQQMSDMDGLQLAQAIRQDQGLRGMQLMLCSSVDSSGSEPEVDACLSKPVRQSDLYNSLLQMLGELSPDRPPKRARLAQDEDGWFGGRQLLLVEDNLVNQEVAREILIDAGFAIEIRENGLDALQAVQEQDYDAVLMDIQMPVMDGLESARRIRALGGRFTDLPIIAMTAHALIGDSDKSLAAGMNDHVTKPIDPERLLATLAKWLQPTKRQAASADNGEPETGYADTAPQEIPALPGIDVADGLTRLRGNPVVYRRILLSFYDQQADAAERLEGFIAEGDWQQAASLAHTLKGSGGNLGAKQLYAQAASMEHICRSGDAEAAQASFGALRASLAEVMDGLAALARQGVVSEPVPADGESRSSDPAAMHALIGKLLVFLDSDLGEAQACIDALRQSAGSDYAASLGELDGALNRFDIEAAKEVALSVRNTL